MSKKDTGVNPQNSVVFDNALKAAQVPEELHMYNDGAHGTGIRLATGDMAQWPDSGGRLARQDEVHDRSAVTNGAPGTCKLGLGVAVRARRDRRYCRKLSGGPKYDGRSPPVSIGATPGTGSIPPARADQRPLDHLAQRLLRRRSRVIDSRRR